MNPPNEVGVPFLVFAETPPNGTLEADGASLLRASYPALFAKYGTSYGAADETHFNLPDMRGRFPRIWAHGQATDPDRATRTAPGATGATLVAGDHVGTEQAEAYKQHQHSLTTYGNDINTAGKVGAGNSSVTVSTAYTTNEGGNETRPVNTALMMVVRY
jgi:microcystin-dependent protein